MNRVELLVERHRLRLIVKRRDARIDVLKLEMEQAKHRLFCIDRDLRILDREVSR